MASRVVHIGLHRDFRHYISGEGDVKYFYENTSPCPLYVSVMFYKIACRTYASDISDARGRLAQLKHSTHPSPFDKEPFSWVGGAVFALFRTYAMLVHAWSTRRYAHGATDVNARSTGEYLKLRRCSGV